MNMMFRITIKSFSQNVVIRSQFRQIKLIKILFKCLFFLDLKKYFYGKAIWAKKTQFSFLVNIFAIYKHKMWIDRAVLI